MKIFKVIFINLLVLLLLFSLSEFFLFKQYQITRPDLKYKIEKVPYENLVKTPGRFRKTSGLNYKKQPIIIFGCSYAYGEFLDDEDTISAKLSKLSERPVYNYAIKGKGLQNTLFIVENKLYDTNIKNPQYAIYIMMSDQIRRLYTNACPDDYVAQPIYKFNKFGEPVIKSSYYPRYRQFYSFYYLNNLVYKYILEKQFDRHNRYVTLYFEQIQRQLKQQFPDIKFIILMFGDKNNFGLDMSRLKDDGFTVISTEELTGINFFDKKYQVSEKDIHPNSKVWEIVASKLVEKYKL